MAILVVRNNPKLGGNMWDTTGRSCLPRGNYIWKPKILFVSQERAFALRLYDGYSKWAIFGCSLIQCLSYSPLQQQMLVIVKMQS